MRIDHFAYQRGTRVAAFGMLLQFVIGLTILLFGWLTNDTAFVFVSQYILLGVIVWLSLVVIFHQHKLERLEALEEDELAAARGGTSSIFDATADEARVAARRLGLMHKWMMPLASLLLAVLLCGLAALMLRWMAAVGEPLEENGREFHLTRHVGWAMAVCLSFALVSFIFSRFVAGMAKLEAWQNLRGGAGYMVGNALVLVALAAALIFRVFGNDEIIRYVAYAVPVFMFAVALEILLNFVLNLYRPRIAGEVPRPAFDSRVLSLFAAPDSIVRSLNEAVNYQFGFDITSSWGYQLLLRSFVWLIALGVGVFILLNTMVVIEPHQEGIRLRHGRIIGDVHGSGVMWKYPWPVETAEPYDVTSIREISLTARRLQTRPLESWQIVDLWTDDIRTDEELDPFIVGSSSAIGEIEELKGGIDLTDVTAMDEASRTVEEDEAALFDETSEPTEEDEAIREVSRTFALIDAEMTLQYRIRSGQSGEFGESELLNYLNFVPDTATRRRNETMRDQAIRAIALREITQHLSTLSLDEALAHARGRLSAQLQQRIQAALDRPEIQAGVDVVAVNIPMLRPSGSAAASFEELPTSHQARQQRIAMARRNVVTQLAILVGDPEETPEVLAGLDEWDRLRDELGPDAPATVEQRERVEQMLHAAGGAASLMIRRAETDRWQELMSRRAQAVRTQSRLEAYRAAPRLFEQRELMGVLMSTLQSVRKYIIGIDPSRISIDTDLKELAPLLDFSQSRETEGGSR